MSVEPFEKPICVTRPFLPPIDDFCSSLREIWDNHCLTNDGPILRRFTAQLAEYLKVPHVSLFSNGTLALQLGMKGLGLSGEVITTPFTFVATTHAVTANGLRPVFVDIEPDYFTIDPERVRAAITSQTTAILAVHVYGHPCRVHELAQIAASHRLALLYDSAHAFGVEVNEKSIAQYGDLSMFSFHATKLFHTMEGGALAFRDGRYETVFNLLKNFGFEGETEVTLKGSNAKMTEMQALMGVLLLPYLESIMDKRRELTAVYHQQLREVPGIRLVAPPDHTVRYNWAYMPIQIFTEEFGMSRDELYERLKTYNVFTRRYFYPLVCGFSCYSDHPLVDPLTVARSVAERILCLPIYPDLELEEAARICEIIRHIQHTSDQSYRTTNGMGRTNVPDLNGVASATSG